MYPKPRLPQLIQDVMDRRKWRAADRTVFCTSGRPNVHPWAALLHVHGGGFVMGIAGDGCRAEYRAGAGDGVRDSVQWITGWRLSIRIRQGWRIVLAAFEWSLPGGSIGIAHRGDRGKCWRWDRGGAGAAGAGGGLACQVLDLSDARAAGAADASDPRVGRYIWTRASNGFCWEAYLGGPTGDFC